MLQRFDKKRPTKSAEREGQGEEVEWEGTQEGEDVVRRGLRDWGLWTFSKAFAVGLVFFFGEI